MFTPRNLRKRVGKRGRPPTSQTPGIKKDKNRCQASKDDRYFAKRSRARHDPQYADWCRKIDRLWNR